MRAIVLSLGRRPRGRKHVFHKRQELLQNARHARDTIALQNAVTFAVGLADNVMIGTLGDSAISGVYVGSQLQTLLQMFIGGIEGAILILAAQYWGKRDTKSIRRIAAIGVRFALLIGLVITVTAFLLPSQIVSLFTSDASVIESGTVYVRVVTFRTFSSAFRR